MELWKIAASCSKKFYDEGGARVWTYLTGEKNDDGHLIAMLRKSPVPKEDLPNFREAIEEGIYVSGKRVMKRMSFISRYCKTTDGVC